jgi:hypothetical protein
MEKLPTACKDIGLRGGGISPPPHPKEVNVGSLDFWLFRKDS